jgi:hypothetical protein
MPTFRDAARSLASDVPEPSAINRRETNEISVAIDGLLDMMVRQDELDEDDDGEEMGNSPPKNSRFGDVYNSNICTDTRSNYHGANSKFAIWLFSSGHCNCLDNSLTDALRVENATAAELSRIAQSFIAKAGPNFQPIVLSLLTVEMFVNFLLSMRPEGEFLSKSTYGGYRSALLDLFRDCQFEQPPDFKTELKRAYSGLKRKAQQYKAATGARLGEGKKPLSFALYKKLCEWLIADGGRESLFSWAFLTITWNLMCRSKNTVNIHRNHISWENDSLTIQFAHQKTDMAGFDEGVKRHVYANPKDPTICPVLALSAYLSNTPIREVGLLFSGKNQYERFRKNLSGIIGSHKEEIIAMGVDPSEIGVHSIRKGSATYACNGTTCSPSITAVCNRAGWTMGGVKDTYLQYEAAQDQYVGRIVCGLNIHSHEFSMSPAFFMSAVTDNRKVFDDIKASFPIPLEANSMLVMKFCFASLYYFRGFLLKNLGSSSPLRLTYCMRNSILETKREWIALKCAHEESELQLSGIPPHVVYLVRLQDLQERFVRCMAEQRDLVTRLCDEVVARIRADLDARSIGGGEVSINRFQEMLKPLQDSLNDLIKNQQPGIVTNSQEESDVTSMPAKRGFYFWGGKYRKLPETYMIESKMSILTAWQIWHHGDGKEIALKFIDQFDLCDNYISKGRQRPIREAEIKKWNNLRFVCTELDAAVDIRGRTPSSSELVKYYSSEHLKSVLPSQLTPKNRHRRADELGLRHAADIMRKEKKGRVSL